jgi:hypothetical protein
MGAGALVVVTLTGGHRHSNPYPLATSHAGSGLRHAAAVPVSWWNAPARLVALALLAWQRCVCCFFNGLIGISSQNWWYMKLKSWSVLISEKLTQPLHWSLWPLYVGSVDSFFFAKKNECGPSLYTQ